MQDIDGSDFKYKYEDTKVLSYHNKVNNVF